MLHCGEHLKNIFKITEEEEAAFDTVHAAHIETYTSINTYKIEPYRLKFIRLFSNCFYTRPISLEELKRHFKRTKNTSNKYIQRMFLSRPLPHHFQESHN